MSLYNGILDGMTKEAAWPDAATLLSTIGRGARDVGGRASKSLEALTGAMPGMGGASSMVGSKTVPTVAGAEFTPWGSLGRSLKGVYPETGLLKSLGIGAKSAPEVATMGPGLNIAELLGPMGMAGGAAALGAGGLLGIRKLLKARAARKALEQAAL